MSVPYKGITLDRTLRLYGNGKLPLSILKQVHCGGTMYGPAAWWFNVMWDDAKKAGITLKATGRGYRPYGSQEAMFLDRYSRTPTLRKPVVTRKWKGHTWWLKRGKSRGGWRWTSRCLRPPLHGWSTTPPATGSTFRVRSTCRPANPTPNTKRGIGSFATFSPNQPVSGDIHN